MADTPATAEPKQTTLADAMAPAPSVLGDAPADASKTAPADAAKTTPADGKTTTAATPAVADGEIKLTVPKDSGLTEDHAKQVAEFAKANKMSQAQAEQVLARDAKAVADQATAKKAAEADAVKQQFQQAEKIKADGAKLFAQDPDFGGEKLQASVLDAKRAVAKYADPDLQKFLATHPLGSDPLVLRMLARVGATLREDQTNNPGAGSPGTSKATDTPTKWYGESKP